MPSSDIDENGTPKGEAAKLVSTDPDGDRLVYRVPDPPTDGSVTIDQRDGTYTYTPKLGESD